MKKFFLLITLLFPALVLADDNVSELRYPNGDVVYVGRNHTVLIKIRNKESIGCRLYNGTDGIDNFGKQYKIAAYRCDNNEILGLKLPDDYTYVAVIKGPGIRSAIFRVDGNATTFYKYAD
ncbi:hypothetical protein HGT70_04795 [Rosenbergiella collisarenosi]|uniref:hypothetical protein n=1 Tax=Rosenbergiella collisarenosi TaxID=1544695 RepID=UPI001BD9819A|nr:hypothetical protein [Rosenbergiella collisarenosi]MBT0720602.1 hypothetical protein [Rosenbergiella collisarenosi]